MDVVGKLNNWSWEDASDRCDFGSYSLMGKLCYKRSNTSTEKSVARIFRNDVDDGGFLYVGFIYIDHEASRLIPIEKVDDLGVGKAWQWVVDSLSYYYKISEDESLELVKFLVDIKLCDIGYKINKILL